jgi:hypothetical protein
MHSTEIKISHRYVLRELKKKSSYFLFHDALPSAEVTMFSSRRIKNDKLRNKTKDTWIAITRH